MHVDLLETARQILCRGDGANPSQTDLRRSVSTAYYALFHHISLCCSDLLGRSEVKSLTRAKNQIYRSINHRDVTAACNTAKKPGLDFPKPVSDYAALFLSMYRSRCDADYDPTSEGNFNLPQVQNKIGEVEQAIQSFDAADEDDRRAFAVLIVVKSAKSGSK